MHVLLLLACLASAHARASQPRFEARTSINQNVTTLHAVVPTPSLVHNGSSSTAATPSLVHNESAVTPSLVHNGSSSTAVTPSLVHNGSSSTAATPSLVHNGSSSTAATPSLVHNGSSSTAVTPSLVHNGSSSTAVTPSLIHNNVTENAATTPSVDLESMDSGEGLTCNATVNQKILALGMLRLGDSFYYFSDSATERLNWTESLRFCRGHGLHLASVETEKEHKLFLAHTKDIDIATGGSHFWLGGTAKGHDGTWHWSASGHNLTFTAWYTGHPYSSKSRRQQKCLAMYAWDLQNNWFDQTCSDRRRYVCELNYPCLV